MLFHFTCTLCNKPEFQPQTCLCTWRSPEQSHLMWHCGSSPATTTRKPVYKHSDQHMCIVSQYRLGTNAGDRLRGMCPYHVSFVPGGNKGHMATSQHQSFPYGSIGRLWGPAENRGGDTASTMSNGLLLTTLEQAETQPCLCQVRQQPKAHTPEERWGIEPCRLVEGGPTGGCSRPSNELHHCLAANPYTAHADSPTAHTQRHLRQSRQQPRPPVSRKKGAGDSLNAVLGVCGSE